MEKTDKRLNSIKDWYRETYPTDTLGEEMNGEITFEGLMVALSNGLGHYVYDFLGVQDSIIRERVFTALATIYEKDYEVIYTMWLYWVPFCKTFYTEY